MCSTTDGVDRHRPVGEPFHEPDPAARRVGLHLAERPVRRARRQAEAAVRARVDELALDHAWASSARMRSCSAREGGIGGLDLTARGRPRPRPTPRRLLASHRRACALRRAGTRLPRAAFEHHGQPLLGHVEGARDERRAEDHLPLGLSVTGDGRDERRRGIGQRVQAQAGATDDAQRAARAAQELAEVVAGDVLHHLPPEFATSPSPSTTVTPSRRSRILP